MKIYETQISEDHNENKQLQNNNSKYCYWFIRKTINNNTKSKVFLLIYQPLDIIKLNMVVILQKSNNLNNSNHNQ